MIEHCDWLIICFRPLIDRNALNQHSTNFCIKALYYKVLGKY